jgi:hypothetical protein
VEVNNKEIEWNGMDCIRLDQDGNLYVITKPRVLKGTEDFLSR